MRYVIDVDRYGKRTHIIAFDSINENVKLVLSEWDRPDPPVMFDPKHHHPRTGDFFFTERDRVYGDHYWPSHMTRRGWLGRTDLRDWSDLRRAIREPWDLGMEAVDEMRAKIGAVALPTPMSIRRRSQWSDDPGGAFDLDRFLDAQPAFRVTVNRHAIGRQFVTLFVCNDVFRSNTYHVAYWRSVVASVVAERLEEAGYSVEVIIYSANGDALKPNPTAGAHDEQHIVTAVWVKRFEDPLNIAGIVTAASPWYMRIVKFATLHCVPGEQTGEAYGYVDTLDPAYKRYFTPNADVHVIEGVWSESAAESEARAILDRYAHGQPGDGANPESEDDG